MQQENSTEDAIGKLQEKTLLDGLPFHLQIALTSNQDNVSLVILHS